MNNNAAEAGLYLGMIVLGVVGFGIYVLATSAEFLDLCLPALALLVGAAFVAWASRTALDEVKDLADWWQNRQMAKDIHQVTLAKAQLDLALVQPDAAGMLPVARQLLASGALTQQVLALAAQHVANGAPVANVPHSITYSPHMAYKNDVNATGQVAAALPASVQPGDFWSLYSGGKLPANGFLMGYSLEDGQPVTADWKQLYSALIGGQSGSGKSTLIRNVLAQSALQGGRFVVLDPHFGAGEESLGASLMPLRSLMLCDVASNEKAMADALRYVFDIGKRRLSGQDKDETPLVLVVDETTALLQRSNVAGDLLTVLGEIAQETRKRGVYAMCIGQQFHSEFFDTTVRNSFVSQISTRARRDVARVQTGNNQFAKEVETLTIGQAVWMQPDGTVVKIAVPNTTAQHIMQVGQMLQNGPKAPTAALLEVEPVPLSVPLPVPHAVEWMEAEPATTDARTARVLQMYANGATMTEIIADVWGITDKGRAWQKANVELNDILRKVIASSLS